MEYFYICIWNHRHTLSEANLCTQFLQQTYQKLILTYQMHGIKQLIPGRLKKNLTWRVLESKQTIKQRKIQTINFSVFFLIFIQDKVKFI